jgi:hypothetical protein
MGLEAGFQTSCQKSIQPGEKIQSKNQQQRNKTQRTGKIQGPTEYRDFYSIGCLNITCFTDTSRKLIKNPGGKIVPVEKIPPKNRQAFCYFKNAFKFQRMYCLLPRK